MSDLGGLLGVGDLTDEWPGQRRFTLHLDFLAVDEVQARDRAQAYAEGLNQLRREVDCYTARLSVDGDWATAVPVFCGAAGPDEMDVCIDSAGHPGWHHGPGGSGRWPDGDVPKAPNNAEGWPGGKVATGCGF